MTLGDIIKEYRKNHSMSMDDFAQKSGISKAYISVLEKNMHPRTGKAISPSIRCIKQAACGMDMTFDSLFNSLSDIHLNEESKDVLITSHPNPIEMQSFNSLSSDKRYLAYFEKLCNLSDENKEQIFKLIDQISEE